MYSQLIKVEPQEGMVIKGLQCTCLHLHGPKTFTQGHVSVFDKYLTFTQGHVSVFDKI